MEKVMTCENCGCSFTDVESDDYTSVLINSACVDCVQEIIKNSD